MIDPQKREAIYVLHKEGMAIRKIARSLKVDRKTVRRIIA
jgi:Helix-turn-helix domain of resolvase.